MAKNAERLAGWCDLKTIEVSPVKAVVVVWSPAGVEPDSTIDPATDVEVVSGLALRQWLSRGSASHVATVPPEKVAAAWHVLNKHLQRRESSPRSGESEKPPRSFAGWLAQITATTTASMLGVVAAGHALASSGPIAWRILIAAALTAAGQPLRRLPALRLPALGWQAGAAGLTTMTLMVTAALELTGQRL